MGNKDLVWWQISQWELEISNVYCLEEYIVLNEGCQQSTLHRLMATAYGIPLKASITMTCRFLYKIGKYIE